MFLEHALRQQWMGNVSVTASSCRKVQTNNIEGGVFELLFGVPFEYSLCWTQNMYWQVIV